MAMVDLEAREGDNMCKKYILQAKRPCEKEFTEWCNTDDYETIERNIKVIESYGYLWRVKGLKGETEQMKSGDVYLNRYAGENDPSRVFMVTSLNNKWVYGKCVNNGKLDRVYFRKANVRNDTEHYIRIGSIDVDGLIAEKLTELRGADNEQREADV